MEIVFAKTNREYQENQYYMDQSQPIVFGEVLFDYFPDGTKILGGAPFNVAWHLQGFSLCPLLLSRVGHDADGSEVIRAMTFWEMESSCIELDQERSTGTVQVTLENGEPNFEISPEHAYGYINADCQVLSARSSLLYHGTLALWHPAARKVLQEVKDRCQAPVFVDVNLRSPWWERDTVLSMLEGASWVKLNEAELGLLTPLHDTPEEKARVMLEYFQLQALLVTKGEEGAIVYLPGGECYHTAPAYDVTVVDTVGAGDAFSAVYILGLMNNWSVEETLACAQEFASNVVGQRGATISDRNVYRALLSKWAVR